MLTNTCTLEESAGRRNILVHGKNGTLIEVRDSYVGIVGIVHTDGFVSPASITGATWQEMPDGSHVWRIDGKLARVACLRAERYDPEAKPAVGPPGAFVTFTDWPRVERVVAEIRRDWGNIPVQVNAA
jgi:hypothetical protein